MPTTWTPEKEARLQYLDNLLTPKPQPAPPQADGLLGYTGKALANVVPNAFSNLFNMSNSLLGVHDDATLPTPFAEQAPQGGGQTTVRLLTGIAEMIPSMAIPELGVAKAANVLGAAPKVARVIGGAAGFGLPAVHGGAESMAIQGGVGASLTAVRDMGWKAKTAAAIGGGLAGYYEGSKTSDFDAKLQAGLNVAFPLIIDPLLHRLTGLKTNAGNNSVKPPGTTTPATTGPLPHTARPGEMVNPPFHELQGQPIEEFAPLQTTSNTNARNAVAAWRAQQVEGQVWINDRLPSERTPRPIIFNETLPTATESAIPSVGDRGMGMTQVGTPLPFAQPAAAAPAPSRWPLGIHFNEPPLAPRETPGPIQMLGAEPIEAVQTNVRAPDSLLSRNRIANEGVRAPEKTGGILQVAAPEPVAPLQLAPRQTPGPIQMIGVEPIVGVERSVRPADAPAAPVARLQSTRIEGPVLYHADTGQVLAEGPLGTSHADLMLKALKDPTIDTGKIAHGFKDEHGQILGRKSAWQVAEKAGQIKPAIQSIKKTGSLESQDLAKPNPTQPVRPAAESGQPPVKEKVLVLDDKTRNWTEATVLSRENGVAHLQVEDRVHGTRERFVNEKELRPVGDDARLTAEESPKLQTNGAYWLAPDGTFHDLGDDITHHDAAKRILGGNLNRNAAYKQLIEKGWIRVAGDYLDEYYLTQKHGQPIKYTKEQRIALEDQSFHGYKITEDYGATNTRTLFEAVKPPEGDVRSSIESGPGPHAAAGIRTKANIDLAEGLTRIPKEAADIVGNLVASLQEATGQGIDFHLFTHDRGSRGKAYTSSGKVGFSLHNIINKFRNWNTMSDAAKSRNTAQMLRLIGHEITHVAQAFGEASGLTHEGKSLLSAIQEAVFSIPLEDRLKISALIKKAGGDAEVASHYLAGDFEKIKEHYQKRRGPMTDEQVKVLAAGEVMAEIGSIELSKRAKLDWLPPSIRSFVDTFKQAIVSVVAWLKGEGKQFAALQKLSDISNKMFDHFGAADRSALNNAFPHNEIYRNPAHPSFPKAQPLTPPTVAGAIGVAKESLYTKQQLVHLGVRGAVGGVAGGVIAPAVSDHQVSMAEGILYGGVLGMAGPAVAKALMSKDFTAEVVAIAKRTGGNPFKVFKAIMNGKTSEELGREGVRGFNLDGTKASGVAKIVRFMEKELGWNMPPEVKSIMETAKGYPQDILHTVNDAMEKAKWYKPSPALLTKEAEYLEGRITRQQFESLLTTAEEKTYGTWVTTARQGMTQFTLMLADALPKSALKDHMIKTAESYLSRTYSAFREGKFNEAAFEKAKAEFMQVHGNKLTSEVAEMYMRDYQREIQADRSMFSRRGTGEQKIDSPLLMRRLATEEEIQAQMGVLAAFEHNPHGEDYKAAAAKLEWMQKHKITDGWREWLGEYTNPNDRAFHTLQRLYPSAIAAKAFSLFDAAKDHLGTPFALTGEALGKEIERIQQAIKAGHPEAAKMQQQLASLQSYVPLATGPTFGKLGGKYVNRFVRDEMATYDSGFKFMDQPLLRGIAAFNDKIKIGRTILNPLTMIRNYIQTPMFLKMARSNFTDAGRAWSLLRKGADLSAEDFALLQTMRQRHIVGADYITSELGKGPGSLFSGNFDADIATKMAGHTFDKMAEAYQKPDTLVRVASFISARDRIAKELSTNGIHDAVTGTKSPISFSDALNHESTLSRAAAFVERYTMNYSAVPRIVKVARQLPFFSLFLSYTSEITKILKNLTDDLIHNGADGAGRMHAVKTLGLMAAIPTLMIAGAKSNLSKKDREDWEAIESASPDFTRNRFRFPIGRNKDGTFNYWDITSMIPADAYTQMIRAAVNGDGAGFIKANPIAGLQDTPLLNIASSQITGQDIHTGQKIQDLGRVKQVLQEILPPIIPPGYEGNRLQKAFSANSEGGTGLTNLHTGVQTTPSNIVLNYLTGMRFGNVSKDAVQRQATQAAMADIATQQTIARRVLSSNATDEDKQYAAEHLRKVSEEILKSLTTKLQPR